MTEKIPAHCHPEYRTHTWAGAIKVGQPCLCGQELHGYHKTVRQPYFDATTAV